MTSAPRLLSIYHRVQWSNLTKVLSKMDIHPESAGKISDDPDAVYELVVETDSAWEIITKILTLMRLRVFRVPVPHPTKDHLILPPDHEPDEDGYRNYIVQPIPEEN